MGQNLIKKLDSPSHCVQSFLNFADQFQILILEGLGNMKKKCNSVYRTKIFSKLPTFFWVVFTQTAPQNNPLMGTNPRKGRTGKTKEN